MKSNRATTSMASSVFTERLASSVVAREMCRTLRSKSRYYCVSTRLERERRGYDKFIAVYILCNGCAEH